MVDGRGEVRFTIRWVFFCLAHYVPRFNWKYSLETLILLHGSRDGMVLRGVGSYLVVPLCHPKVVFAE